MNSELAIKVEGVYKNFKLPHEKTNSLKSAFLGVGRKRSKKTESQHALKDISFEVMKGEFFGIVGRNGSGKSTLLKLIAEIYLPTKGKIHHDGKLVPFIELGVGFNPELTGRENVYLNGALLGFSTKEVDAMYDDIVQFAELERFMDQKLKNYSSGMQVRLAFSVATRSKADILLIDEVLAVGDADFQRKCFEYFKFLKREKKTVVFVTHDMNAVIEYCDRAILVSDSQLIEEGSPEKIAMSYKRLFQPPEDVDVKPADQERWGDESVIISHPAISKKMLKDDDEELIITYSVEAVQAKESLITGFSISGPDGEPVVGTNNNIKKQFIKSIQTGERLDFEWTVPNIFSDGIHDINLDITHSGGNIIADRWERAMQFRVNKVEKTPYSISPKILLKSTINRKESDI